MIYSIYRISDLSNQEKIKPSYASKEGCLLTFIREFGTENLSVVCDNVTKETHEMVCQYVPAEQVQVTRNGNTGAFLHSWGLAEEITEKAEETDIVYFVEDDYIHRRGAKGILLEGFEQLNAQYLTLYDHPDKYQDTKHPKHVWGHSRVDEERAGVRVPGILYAAGRDCRLYVSKSCHWRTVGSTTMTFATTVKNIREDYEDMLALHTGQQLPMGGATFKVLKEKGKELLSPVPSYSTHAEERWMAYFVNWQKEAQS